MRSAVTAVLVALVRCYQRLISPFFPPRCRYIPSCSEYFIEALQKKGPVVGFLMGTWRILRCHPFAKGGYDPVR